MPDVTRFPVSTWQRIWNRRGERAVSCIVSGRWLRFGEVATAATGYLPGSKIGTPIDLDVMTDQYDGDEGAARKICTLVVTYEELKAVVQKFEAEIASRENKS